MKILITNESLKNLFHIATSIAKENYNQEYGAPHLLQALMHRDINLRDILLTMGKDPNYLYEWAEVRIEEYPKATSNLLEINPSVEVENFLEAADDIRIKLGLDEITPLCLLGALVKPHVAFSVEQLKSMPLRDHEILNYFLSSSAIQTEDLPANKFSAVLKPGILGASLEDPKNFQAIQKYCINWTAQAQTGKPDNIIGRDKEIRSLIEILCRRSKPNVIIVGEPGVGKTALVEGFANEIIRKQVPLLLTNAILLELDISLLFSGASYSGEVEDRLKQVITESKKLDKVIFFIDEIHILLDSKNGSGKIANLLKPELARGKITVIGATTHEEYRKIIEPERAFNRRFELLSIEEPDTMTCVKMISSVLDKYKEYHQIEVEPAALPECIRLARRYAKGKKLPDAAIDLLDRTMASVRMLDELSVKELEQWKEVYDNLYSTEFEDEKEKIAEIQWAYEVLKNKVNPILWGFLKEQPQIDNTIPLAEIHKTIESIYQELLFHAKNKHERVGKLELAAVMAAKTQIPIGKIQAQEKEKLLNMEQYLKKRLIGQDHALKILSDALIENRSGLNKPGQPIGSFFLLGPTGTGKTELAKSIAELLFNDEKAMIRFDMSEFKEEHSAALLYGAPQGYVGYEEGGMLVNKIRQQPYAVVLFDEIEKAHPSVFDIVLQIMDEGKIHDKLGKEGDFSNALILFTSNIASAQITEKFAQNQIPNSSELMSFMVGYFRPEFLARITEIIPFSPITEKMAEKIFKIQLKTLINTLNKLGITIAISEETIQKLSITGYNSQYGARQISGIIRSELTRPISKKIVSGEVKTGDKIQINWDAENRKVIMEI